MNATQSPQTTPGRKPTSPVLITAIISLFAATTAPVTAFLYNRMELTAQTDKQKHELALQEKQQEHEIQVSFLREIEKSCGNTAYRRDLLSFYSEVHPDEEIRKWAAKQRDQAVELLEAEAELSEGDGLMQMVSKVQELEQSGAAAKQIKEVRDQAFKLTSTKKEVMRLQAQVHGKMPAQEDLEELRAAAAL